MTRTGTASETIAEFAVGFDRARMSAATLRQCGRALADTLAVGIAELAEPSVGQALRYVEGSAPGLDGGNSQPASARLWGTGRTAPIETAALFNGISAHVLDFDDASSPMSGHPSVALLPALVALAEARDIEGQRLASAYVVGFEICCKVGRALDLTHYARGWHMTSSVGTIAAAAACGHLLGMDLAHIVNAIGLAVAQTGGTRENFGTGAKSFKRVNATQPRYVLSCWPNRALPPPPPHSMARPVTPHCIQRRGHFRSAEMPVERSARNRKQRHRGQEIPRMLHHPSSARRSVRPAADASPHDGQHRAHRG